ncbi:MAG: peptidylprolyl isomerase [Porticoccaceae bacterium]|nr:peptidylprolyl isomerase [Porticoccaceae bacterium]
MSMMIDQGVKVTMSFSLALENGELIDSNFDTQPATFIMGDGNLLPGFEVPLKGLKAGDKGEFVISPENAFGQRNPENMQQLARDNFDQESLNVGDVFSFQNGEGELPGVIMEIGDDSIKVDFNHPLAGRNIIFKVDIVEVVPDSIH